VNILESKNMFSFLQAIPFLIKSRTEAIFIWSWMTAVVCLILGRGFPPLQPSIMAVLTMALLSMSMYFYNDIIDKEMDALNPNKKYRPLPSKIVSENDAMKIVLITGLLGLSLALLIHPYCFIFGSLYIFLLTSYSHPQIRLKKRVLSNVLAYFSCYLLASLIAGFAVTNTFSSRALFSGFIFGFFITSLKPIFGDFSDAYEDKLFGMKHLGVILSWKRKMQLMIFTILFIMTITPLTYARFGFNTIFPIFVLATSLVFLRTLFPIMNKFEEHELVRTKKYAHIYFFALQFLMIIGSLNL
jgi:4-hydroxybenzoate polyprenyltransferase